MRLGKILPIPLAGFLVTASTLAAEVVPKGAAPFLERHCIRCHGAEKMKGKVRFDNLTKVDPENAALWKSMKEMVQFGDMPPEDEPRPSAGEREQFLDWITAGLSLVDGALDDHQSLYDPAQGNLVDHEKLFDGSITGPASSPPRFWRRSQPETVGLRM